MQALKYSILEIRKTPSRLCSTNDNDPNAHTDYQGLLLSMTPKCDFLKL